MLLFQKLKMSTDFRNRIQIIERINDVPVVFFKEQDKPTLEGNMLLWKYLEDISNETPFYLIIDVSTATPPKAEIRAYIKKRLNASKKSLLHSYIIPGSNLFIKFGLKFILASMGLKCFTVVNSQEEAISQIKSNV